jgi:hypothetical protein
MKMKNQKQKSKNQPIIEQKQEIIGQKQRFTEIYNKNLFNGDESRSGTGSSLRETEIVRKELPKLLKDFNITTMVDAPCGDWNWMKTTDLSSLSKYIGIDIVEKIIKDNKRYSDEKIEFKSCDLIEDDLPKADLILCRDCLVHLVYDDIFKALKNFKKSGSKYLLTTTFPSFKKNQELIVAHIWRALNLELEPFFFKKPIYHIIEGNFGEEFQDKVLALWDIDSLNI